MLEVTQFLGHDQWAAIGEGDEAKFHFLVDFLDRVCVGALVETGAIVVAVVVAGAVVAVVGFAPFDPFKADFFAATAGKAWASGTKDAVPANFKKSRRSMFTT